MEVIPRILDESMVKRLPKEMLHQLSECSTQVIKHKVKEYLEDSNADEEVKAIVKEAYAEQILMDEYLHSEVLAKEAEQVLALDYSSITPNLSVEELEELHRMVGSILNNKYAIPYVAPISGATIKDICEQVYNKYKETENVDYKQLYQKLKKHSYLFRESQFAPHRGTVVKKIVKDRTKYLVILRGIEFMLDKKRSNSLPSSWRYL